MEVTFYNNRGVIAVEELPRYFPDIEQRAKQIIEENNLKYITLKYAEENVTIKKP